ncbi:hypothetical protein B5E87_00165 [Massilimicrobiota sp. An142]|uniref:hypothetical protein n=1 Tax=Massilimicrobiota sp. An142 TaxID=1965564 RepID=UPI000B3AB4E4|nr:hypothetical protein [Massilimicrobiota sp. An142]OUQ15020.1 hypothetical protein B5E87_00165 [Massilimicrobiota sp. An142]
MIDTLCFNNKEINLKHKEWLILMKNSGNINEIVKSQIFDEEILSEQLNNNSSIFKLFNHNISNYRYKNKLKIESFEEAEKLINRLISFSDIFGVKVNEDFRNMFYVSGTMRVLRNNKLMFHFSERLIFNEGKKYEFDHKNITCTVIQLFKVVNNIRFYQKAIELLCEELNIEIVGMEMRIKMRERKKIINNISKIKEIDRYRHLSQMIKKNMFVFEQIQMLALDNSYKNSFNNNGNIIILLTSSYIHNLLKKINESITQEEGENFKTKTKVLSQAYIRRLMVTYQVLGLINIVDNPPEQLRKMENKNNKFSKDMKYYIIQELTNAKLKEADILAKKLLDNGVRVSNITKDKINLALEGKMLDVKEEDIDDIIMDFSIK